MHLALLNKSIECNKVAFIRKLCFWRWKLPLFRSFNL